MSVRVSCVLLSLLASACATVGPRSSCTPAVAPNVPVAQAAGVAERAVSPGCEGVEVELLVREDPPPPEGAWARRVVLRCHARGATVSYETDHGPELEGGSETVELAPAEAAALWAELRGVSLAGLECAPGSGARRHRVRVVAPGGTRVVECAAAETPPAWSALEVMLNPTVARGDEETLWPFDAEYWRGELGYARSSS